MLILAYLLNFVSLCDGRVNMSTVSSCVIVFWSLNTDFEMAGEVKLSYIDLDGFDEQTCLKYL